MKTRKNKNVMKRLNRTKMKGSGKKNKKEKDINYSVQNQTVEIELSNESEMNFDSRYLNFMDDNTNIDFRLEVGGPSKIISDTLHGKTYALGKQILFNQSSGYMKISQKDKTKPCKFNISSEGGGRQIYAIKCNELNTYQLWKNKNKDIDYNQKYNENRDSVPNISFYIQESALVGNTPSVFSDIRFRKKNKNIEELTEINKIKESEKREIIDEAKEKINDNDNDKDDNDKDDKEGGGLIDNTKNALHKAVNIATLGTYEIIIGMVNDSVNFFYDTIQDLMMHSLISTDPENDLAFIRVMGVVVKKKLEENEVIYVNPHTLCFWESSVNTEIVAPTGGNFDKKQNIKGYFLGVDAGFLLKVTGPGLIIINGRRYTKSEIESQFKTNSFSFM